MDDSQMQSHADDTDRWLAAQEEPPPWHDDPCCPACGQVIDFCQGHGTLGDPEGARILEQHDDDEHGECDSRADCRVEDGAP